MIVSKDSVKIGFLWYGKAVLKLCVSVATVSYIGAYPIVGIVGILAAALFAYEIIGEYKLAQK